MTVWHGNFNQLRFSGGKSQKKQVWGDHILPTEFNGLTPHPWWLWWIIPKGSLYGIPNEHTMYSEIVGICKTESPQNWCGILRTSFPHDFPRFPHRPFELLVPLPGGGANHAWSAGGSTKEARMMGVINWGDMIGTQKNDTKPYKMVPQFVS